MLSLSRERATTIVIVIVGRAITLERKLSKKKQSIDTKTDAKGLRVISLQGAIEKSPILLSQYWKNECLLLPCQSRIQFLLLWQQSSVFSQVCTVGENIIATIKIRNNFCYP